MKDWIECTVDKVNDHYAGRRVVLWGKYNVSEDIQCRLKEKYKIDVDFYVDSDTSKIDYKHVFPIDCLFGKAGEYYIVIPLAFYQSVKDRLLAGGYKPDLDYYYFCDCILHQETDYYEDTNGNKIIGKYQGLKFAFSGFDSVLEIGDCVKFSRTTFYIHSKSKIVIGKDVQMSGNTISVQPSAQIAIGEDAILTENSIDLKAGAHLNIGGGVNVSYLSMRFGKNARVFLHKKVQIIADKLQRALWIVKDDSYLEVGDEGKFYSSGSLLILDDESKLMIGRKISIGYLYYIWLGECSEVTIGEDCLFSQNLIMRSNDGHSIFDVESGQNINSTLEISRARKIMIGNHVWVGIHCTILYDTQIEEGSVIGAMSLVKGNIPNNCIAAGVPAKVIRKNIAWSHENRANKIEECGMEYVHLTQINEGGYFNEKTNNTYKTYYDTASGET